MTVKKLRGVAYLLLLAIISLTCRAQTSVFAPSISVDPATIVHIPIKVDSFSSIVTTQFTLNWDTTALAYKEVKDFGLPLRKEDNFRIDHETGRLAFLWFDTSSDVRGVDLEDSTSIFTLAFEVIGMPNTGSVIAFTDDIAQREIADTTFRPIPARFIGGQVNIRGDNTTSSINIKDIDSPSLLVTPNPTFGTITLKLDLKYATKANLKLYNSHGQLIKNEPVQLSKGKNEMQLNSSELNRTGVFFLQIEAPKFSVTQPLIVL